MQGARRGTEGKRVGGVCGGLAWRAAGRGSRRAVSAILDGEDRPSRSAELEQDPHFFSSRSRAKIDVRVCRPVYSPTDKVPISASQSPHHIHYTLFIRGLTPPRGVRSSTPFAPSLLALMHPYDRRLNGARVSQNSTIANALGSLQNGTQEHPHIAPSLPNAGTNGPRTTSGPQSIVAGDVAQADEAIFTPGVAGYSSGVHGSIPPPSSHTWDPYQQKWVPAPNHVDPRQLALAHNPTSGALLHRKGALQTDLLISVDYPTAQLGPAGYQANVGPPNAMGASHPHYTPGAVVARRHAGPSQGHHTIQGAVAYSGDASLVDPRAAGHVVVGLAAGTGAFNAPPPPPPSILPAHGPPSIHMPPMPVPNANYYPEHVHVNPTHPEHPVGRERCPHCDAGPDGYTTWQWRYGPVSDQLLCSACGQYEGRTGKKRPLKNANRSRRGVA
uniref:GATA-type domain-containing protein n=1 Tax=Mycena chlorophos TaxID=658473 RepID=A0ABQ0L219_MYCCL|nr:predicted protein [Mycena chlorophos]